MDEVEQALEVEEEEEQVAVLLLVPVMVPLISVLKRECWSLVMNTNRK